jgi:ribosomal protein S18 acetylase RimI-like enzyme
MITIRTIKGQMSGSEKLIVGICAYLNKSFVGTCTVSSFECKVPILYNLVVDENTRRRGVATKMILECIHLCRNKAALNLWVDKKNHPAIKLYKKLGFLVCSDEDPIWMTLPIKQ